MESVFRQKNSRWVFKVTFHLIRQSPRDGQLVHISPLFCYFSKHKKNHISHKLSNWKENYSRSHPLNSSSLNKCLFIKGHIVLSCTFLKRLSFKGHVATAGHVCNLFKQPQFLDTPTFNLATKLSLYDLISFDQRPNDGHFALRKGLCRRTRTGYR